MTEQEQKNMIDERIRNLERMHDVMTRMNDEEVYMAWIEWMPDEPSADDIRDVAEDDEMYADCVRVFTRLVWMSGHEGILKPAKRKE